MGDHEHEPAADEEVQDLSDDELDDVAGGSGIDIGTVKGQ